MGIDPREALLRIAEERPVEAAQRPAEEGRDSAVGGAPDASQHPAQVEAVRHDDMVRWGVRVRAPPAAPVDESWSARARRRVTSGALFVNGVVAVGISIDAKALSRLDAVMVVVRCIRKFTQ